MVSGAGLVPMTMGAAAKPSEIAQFANRSLDESSGS